MTTPANQHVLVVDDDTMLCELICDLLRLENFKPQPVFDGNAAIQRATQQQFRRPDAIVLDVMLPDMSGFDVCQQLKLRRDTNVIPIVMLTALTDSESVKSGLRVGANRYLTKPFEPDRLISELRGALAHATELRGRQTHTSVKIQMASDRRPQEQLNDMLSELFLQTPLSDDEIYKIRYAVLEMIQNAAEWGNRGRKELNVTIEYELTAEYLRFVITDEGPGFDRAKLKHAANPDDPTEHLEIREKLGLRHGGFGILVTQGMVDEVKYNEAGNQVTLTKFFRSGAPANS